MIPTNEEFAVKTSVEFAKILCEAHGAKLSLDADSANALADFIETLENRFISKENQTDE